MGPVTAEITIDAPRERVFAAVADLAKRPSFCDHFQESFRLQRIDSTGVGAAARFHVDAPRFAFWMETVIADLEPPHLIVESGRGGRIDRMDVGTAWELTDAGAGMTRGQGQLLDRADPPDRRIQGSPRLDRLAPAPVEARARPGCAI